MSKNKTWICKCGQECLATKNPTKTFPKWEDGHICKFKEIKEE